MNGEPIESLKTLTQRIGGILKIRSDVPIVIHPDNNVPAGEAIRVYDMARANGSAAVFLVGK
jgi:biopolymer transport protein ExbD